MSGFLKIIFIVLIFAVSSSPGFSDPSPDYFRYGDLNNGYIYSKVKNPSGSGVLGDHVKVIPSHYGETGRFNIELKSDIAKGWSGLWIHTSDKNHRVLGFDNMSDRPIKGTTSRNKYQNTIYIPKGARYIGFGVLLQGEGRVD